MKFPTRLGLKSSGKEGDTVTVKEVKSENTDNDETSKTDADLPASTNDKGKSSFILDEIVAMVGL